MRKSINNSYIINTSRCSDYHIFKNIIFAKKTFKDEQYDKYLKIYNILTEGMPKPNIIIYLNANLETLLNRIAKRGREIEKKYRS